MLHSCRHIQVGLPLTAEQLKALSTERLVDRLIARRMFRFAHNVSLYYDLPADRVLEAWAGHQIRQASEAAELDEDVLFDKIYKRLQAVRDISYANVAHVAADRRLLQLAKRLLEREPRLAKQVPLLLKLRVDDGANLALRKALESGDTDLVHYVFRQLELRAGPDRSAFFHQLVQQTGEAVTMYARFCQQRGEFEILEELYEELQQPAAHAQSLAERAYAAPDLQERQELFKQIGAAYKASSNKALAPYAKLAIDEARLLDVQSKLEADFDQVRAPPFILLLILHVAPISLTPISLTRSRMPVFCQTLGIVSQLVFCVLTTLSLALSCLQPFTGLSMAETLLRVLRLPDMKRAEQIRSSFKFSPLRYGNSTLEAVSPPPPPLSEVHHPWSTLHPMHWHSADGSGPNHDCGLYHVQVYALGGTGFG